MKKRQEVSVLHSWCPQRQEQDEGRIRSHGSAHETPWRSVQRGYKQLGPREERDGCHRGWMECLKGESVESQGAKDRMLQSCLSSAWVEDVSGRGLHLRGGGIPFKWTLKAWS